MPVRPLTPADIPALRAVALATWRRTYAPFMSRVDIDRVVDELYPPERLASTPAGACRLVATLQGEVVGYAFAGRDAERRVRLFAIYVLPEHQRHGFGKQLMRAALEPYVAEGEPEAWIGVHPGNHTARRFYELAGAHFDEGRVERWQVAGVAIDEVYYRIALPLAVA